MTDEKGKSVTGAIEEIAFDDAAKYLDALRRSHARWLETKSWATQWIFRGESTTGRPLIPSAWRTAAQGHYLYRLAQGRDHSELVDRFVNAPQNKAFSAKPDVVRQLIIQRDFELLVLRSFCGLVDDLGLSLPGGPIPDPLPEDPFQPPDRDIIHPALGLAQHHRMPTRLLDWTHNPLVAAFFATEGVQSDDGHMVVWALNRTYLSQSRCDAFTVQRSQIGFLHAQEGLFTFSPFGNACLPEQANGPALRSLFPQKA